MKYGIRKIIVTKAVGVTCDEGCCGGKDWGLREAVSEDSYEEKEKEKMGENLTEYIGGTFIGRGTEARKVNAP